MGAKTWGYKCEEKFESKKKCLKVWKFTNMQIYKWNIQAKFIFDCFVIPYFMTIKKGNVYKKFTKIA